MAIENFSILEAVELAVGIEKEGVRFYTLAADKTDDPAMKELFLDLKKKEHEHIVTFQNRIRCDWGGECLSLPFVQLRSALDRRARRGGHR